MLRHLHIRHYALIDTLDLDLYPGLNTITGETGAGKSILLGALGLILGQRAEASVIRPGEKQCVVEALFDIRQYSLQSLLEANGLDYDDQLTIRRMVGDNGKSRAFINDVPVTLGVLRDVAERIIDIHSQHANLLLQDAPFQLSVLDAFAKLTPLVRSYGEIYSQWMATSQQLRQLRSEQAKTLSEHEYTLHQHEELVQARLQPDELEELGLQQQRLAHADELMQNYTQSLALLQGDEDTPGALIALHTLRAHLDRCARVDHTAESLQQRADSVRIELRDLAQEIEQRLTQADADPDELQRVEDRLALLHQLMAKHRCANIAELLSLQETLGNRIENVLHFDEKIQELESTLGKQRTELDTLGQALHEARCAAAPLLGQHVEETLRQVGIPHAQFCVDVSPTPEPGPTGSDAVQLLFTANPQIPPQPLARVASGGEMSRVMLSLKRQLALSTALPTIVFDEIDNGVSGLVATQMGAILSEMSQSLQVINVTHLPQIAACGEHHFLVYKERDAEGTNSRIRLLDPQERVHEIAKMLSGESVGEAALQNARELLTAAHLNS